MTPNLTLREIEVLEWAAIGKTSEETSMILDISLSTVNFHTKNAILKLETANKTAAVAQAMMLGLLQLNHAPGRPSPSSSGRSTSG